MARINGNYGIIMSEDIRGGQQVVLGSSQTALSPYAVWFYSKDCQYYLGAYCDSMESALKVFNRRVADNQ